MTSKYCRQDKASPKTLHKILSGLLLLASLQAHAQSLTTLHSFAGIPDGDNPQAGLVYYAGAFYGTTSSGGDNGLGNIFKMDAVTNTVTVVHSFSTSEGYNPWSALILQAGKLYGTTLNGGASGDGTVFEFDPASGVATTLHSFSGGTTDGQQPGGPVIYFNGGLYGTTTFGGGGKGTGGAGVVYRIDLAAGLESIIYSFKGGTDGFHSYAGLLYRAGFLYGTTNDGGTHLGGTLFSIDLATGSKTTLHNFGPAPDGAYPASGLICDSRHLYGTTSGGGATRAGSVFSFDLASNSETVLYSFTGGSDGETPGPGALVYQNGALTGTTMYGGVASGDIGHGTIFSIDATTGADTTYYAFTGGVDGSGPRGTLLYLNGAFWGTTVYGGENNEGTVFKFTP